MPELLNYKINKKLSEYNILVSVKPFYKRKNIKADTEFEIIKIKKPKVKKGGADKKINVIFIDYS